MRPWRLRVAVRRSRVQWALLGIVLLVSVLSATMLTSLYLLSDATERFAARAALTEAADADIQISHQIVPAGPVLPALASSRDAASTFFEDVPFTVHNNVQGAILYVPRKDQQPALAYYAAIDDVAKHAALREGAWPQPSTRGVVEVAVPSTAARLLGLDLGDTLSLAPFNARTHVNDLVVVGIYDATDPGSEFWAFDRFHGEGYNPGAVVPFTGGTVTTDGFGPYIVDPGVVASIDVDTVVASYIPDFSATSLDQVAGLIPRVDDAELEATATIGRAADSVTVRTRAKTTLGGVLGTLAVTRSSVLVTGLLLLVLAIAALAQTARLMAERRHEELSLMRARGASSRQLLRLALIEAVVLGAATAAAGPILARLTYVLISRQPAMLAAHMNQDPGLPPLVWAVSGLVGLALTVILAAPLLRRGGTFVDSAQARSRPGKRAAFQRSGLDLALAALAALAYWQLRSYNSPVISSGGIVRVDPLLAAGPALALLAGALVCVRLIPAASRMLEGVAARGRRAVGPLAAWEVGRRSARAVSAILLLTLAVSVGSFAMSFLQTWKTSQADQAQFQHPATVQVSGLDVAPLAQQSWVTNEQTDEVAALFYEANIEMTTALQSGTGGRGINGSPVTILATSDAGLTMLDSGRLGGEGGRTIAGALTRGDVSERNGITLPDRPAGVELTVLLTTSETELDNIVCSLRLIVEDAAGLIASVDLGATVIDGKEHTLRATLADPETLARLSGPIRVVGLQSVWLYGGGDLDFQSIQREDDLSLEMSVTGISSLLVASVVPVYGEEPVYTVLEAEAPEGTSWYATAQGTTPTSVTPDGDQIHLEMEIPPRVLLRRAVAISQSAVTVGDELRVVANSALMNRFGIDPGTQGRIEIDGVVLTVDVVDEVRAMPGDAPTAPTLIANFDELQLALLQHGAPAPSVDTWWIQVPADQLDAYLTYLPADATVTTQSGRAAALQGDPLRVGTQAALWLVTAAAILLAAVGFGVHAVVTVRSRELEFAQLRAVGLQRSALTRIVGTESFFLSLLGAVFGIGLGVALGYLVGPLVSVGPDGRQPVPSVIVDVPWLTVGLLAVEVAAVLAVAVLIVSGLLRGINPAKLLRTGD